MSIIVSNNAVSKLTAALTSTATTVNVTGGTGAKFPSTATGDTFYITVVDSSNNYEIMLVTVRTGDIFTVTRAQEGTSARPFSVGDRVVNAITAGTFNSRATKESVDALTAVLEEKTLDIAGKLSAAAGAVGNTNLADSSVTGTKLADSSVTGAKLADLSVTGTKLADSSVTGTKLEDIITAGTVGSASQIPVITFDAKGRVTAATSSPLQARTGEVFLWPFPTAPSGALAIPLIPTDVPRDTYAALHAVCQSYGYPWGAGDGSKIFGLPNLQADGTWLNANGNVGSSTNGQVIAHTHSGGTNAYVGGYVNASGTGPNGWTNVGTTGGSANIAAGSRGLWCIWL